MVLFFFYYNRIRTETNNYENERMNIFTEIYRSSLTKANTTASNFYHYYLTKNNIIENFERAYNANPKEKHIIRHHLASILMSELATNKFNKIRGVNFIFPDNIVFLRSDEPEIYGDNLSYREMIALAHQNKTIYSGFDYGMTEVSFRYVIPIQRDDRFLGLIEVKLSIDYFFDFFNALPNTNTFNIINKSIVDRLLLPESKNQYKQIDNDLNFVIDTISFSKYIQFNKTFSSKNSQDITKIVNSLLKTEQKNNTSITKLIKQNGDYYSFTLIPIHRFTSSTLGYFVISNKDIYISNVIENNIYWYILISIFLIFLTVLYAVRYNYMQKVQKHVEELQKSKNKLDNTLRELQKSQSELQEKQDFTAQINNLLREHERELEHLLMEKDKFISILSHDIKNPIAGIMTDAETLNRYFDKMDDKNKKESINRILLAINNLNKLVKDILDWAMVKLNRLDVQEAPAFPYEILSKVSNQLIKSAQEKGNQILIDCPKDLVINSDPDLLTIIFRNIIQNSIKFTENGIIEVACQVNNENVIFKIKDTGIGIPYENIEKIFKPDKTNTTKGTRGEMGTGLGLLLVKDYITKLRGEIKINSMEGKGTTVEIIFPNNGNQ